MTKQEADLRAMLDSSESDEQAFVFMIMARKPDRPAFTGSLMQCLKHLYQVMLREEVHHPEFPEQVIEELTFFTGARRQTVLRWLELEQQPQGENLIRLQFYLLHHGYDICELRALPKFWTRLVMYVILDDITWDRLAKVMKLKSNQLFAMLSGTKPMPQNLVLSMAYLLVSAHQRESRAILEEANITMIDGHWEEAELDDCHRFLPQELRHTPHQKHRLLKRKKH